MSVEEWVKERLGGYVKLSIEERREAVQELRKDGESTRGVAEVLGVGIATVHRDSESVPDGTAGNDANLQLIENTKDINEEEKLSVPNGTPGNQPEKRSTEKQIQKEQAAAH